MYKMPHAAPEAPTLAGLTIELLMPELRIIAIHSGRAKNCNTLKQAARWHPAPRSCAFRAVVTSRAQVITRGSHAPAERNQQSAGDHEVQPCGVHSHMGHPCVAALASLAMPAASGGVRRALQAVLPWRRRPSLKVRVAADAPV